MATNQQSGNYNATLFTNNNDIDNFFKRFNSVGFADWFTKNINSSSPWQQDYLGNSTSYRLNQANWQIVWANLSIICGKNSLNLIEFLCINSVMINESSSFVPVSEKVNGQGGGNPGIAYAFNSIGGKASYNTLSTNKTAFQCFNNSTYISAHGTQPQSSLQNTTDSRWSGSIYPSGYPTDGTGKTNGFIIEADFFKFRGRGFIQTTNRANYIPLITYVVNYSGSDPAVLATKKAWSIYNGNTDAIAYASTNAQWDNLFQQKNFILAAYAVNIYINGNRKLIPIDPSQSTVNLNTAITKFGKGINGGNYANSLLQRVQVQLDLINGNSNLAASIVSPTTSISMTQSQGRLERTGQDPNSQVGDNKNTGTISGLTNIFPPTVKPSPIIFNIDGN